MEKLVEKQSNGLEAKSGEAEACHQGKPRLVGSGGDFGSTYRRALGTAYVTPQHCLSWAVSTLELGLWLRAGLMHGFPSFLV